MVTAFITSVNGHSISSNAKDFLLIGRNEISKLPRMGLKGTLESDDPNINEPVAIGSTALVKEGTQILTYILFPDNEWTEL